MSWAARRDGRGHPPHSLSRLPCALQEHQHPQGKAEHGEAGRGTEEARWETGKSPKAAPDPCSLICRAGTLAWSETGLLLLSLSHCEKLLTSTSSFVNTQFPNSGGTDNADGRQVRVQIPNGLIILLLSRISTLNSQGEGKYRKGCIIQYLGTGYPLITLEQLYPYLLCSCIHYGKVTKLISGTWWRGKRETIQRWLSLYREILSERYMKKEGGCWVVPVIKGVDGVRHSGTGR